MLTARFRCRVVTPMFLGGANPNDAPEFRPPSVRGLLRYWYRALLGARGEADPTALLQASAQVFGSAETASTVRVRIPGAGSPEMMSPPELLKGEGRSYLWHFIQAGDNDRPGIRPGTPFEVHLSVVPRRAGPSPEGALEEAVRAFWLLVHLGGLGTRSRRFAGAFQAACVDRSDKLTLPSFVPESPVEAWMESQLAHLVEETGKQTATDFDHLGRAHVWMETNSYASCSQAVDEIGKDYKKYRDRLTDGQKLGFGIPIAQGDDGVHVQRSNDTIERRASPLWMQLIEDQSGEYRPVFTLFGGNFLRRSEEVTVDGQTFDQVFSQIAHEFVERRGATLIYPC